MHPLPAQHGRSLVCAAAWHRSELTSLSAFGSAAEVRAFVDSQCRAGLAALCAALVELGQVRAGDLPAEDLRSLLVDAVHRGDVLIGEPVPLELEGFRARPRRRDTIPAQRPKRRADPPAKAKTWVGFRVVWDETGAAIPHVRLRVRAPDGAESEHVTGDDGLVELRGLLDGACDVTCDFDDFSPDRALGFVTAREGFDATAEQPELAQGTRWIVEFDRHRVQTGESMQSLADAAGVSAADLARINFGTDDPEEVRFHLRYTVGCTNENDGEPVFDDADEPGYILVPRPFARHGLVTKQTHVLRVRTNQVDSDWIFSI